MNDSNSVTVSTNYWRVPSVERAFEGWLEGAPTPEERLQVIAKAVADRAAWVPSVEALELVEQLKGFINFMVQIQFWDSSMWLLPQEGPFPLNATLNGVTVLQVDGFPQAFLELSDPAEQSNLDGYSPMSYLQKRSESDFALAPLADLYSITKV